MNNNGSTTSIENKYSMNNKEDIAMLTTQYNNQNLQATPEVITEVSTEVSTTTRNLSLDGFKSLCGQRFTTTFDVIRLVSQKNNHPVKIISKEPIDEQVEDLCFHLVEVQPEKLAKYRKEGIPSFVLKAYGKFYYTPIPDDISFVGSTIIGPHKCAISGKECRKLNAVGCDKVRNFSRYIEKYPWITFGYETFNTKHDSFRVTTCLHYEAFPPRD